MHIQFSSWSPCEHGLTSGAHNEERTTLNTVREPTFCPSMPKYGSMVVWQLNSANKLIYTFTATVTSCAIHAYVSCLPVVSRFANMYYHMVIALSRFLAKGWFTCNIEHCTLLLIMGPCLTYTYTVFKICLLPCACMCSKVMRLVTSLCVCMYV